MPIALDTVDQAIGSVTLWIGIAIGFPFGMAYLAMRNAWKGWRTVSKSVPALRRGAFDRVLRFAVGLLIVGLIVVVSVKALHSEPTDSTPAQITTVSPSPAQRGH